MPPHGPWVMEEPKFHAQEGRKAALRHCHSPNRWLTDFPHGGQSPRLLLTIVPKKKATSPGQGGQRNTTSQPSTLKPSSSLVPCPMELDGSTTPFQGRWHPDISSSRDEIHPPTARWSPQCSTHQRCRGERNKHSLVSGFHFGISHLEIISISIWAGIQG